MSDSNPNVHMKNRKKRTWVIAVSAIVLVCIAAIVVIQLLRNQEDVPGLGVEDVFFSIHDNVLYMDDFIRDEKEKQVLEFDLQNNTFQESSFSRLYNSQDFQDGAILVNEKGVYYNNGSRNKLILKVSEPYFVPKQGIVTDNNHIYIAKTSSNASQSLDDEYYVAAYSFYDYDLENDTLTEIYHYYLRTNQYTLADSINISQINLLRVADNTLYFMLEERASSTTYHWSINCLNLNTLSATQLCVIESSTPIMDCVYSNGMFITLSNTDRNSEDLSLKSYIETGRVQDEATIEIDLDWGSWYSKAVLDSKGTVCYTLSDGIYTYSLDNKTASCIYPYNLIDQELIPDRLYYEDGVMAVVFELYDPVEGHLHMTNIIKEIHVINNDQGPFIWRPEE